ncbi:hypothetical protein Ahy_B09g096020 [Arachis hypogaea]|uniref:Aminotransferase-like plant mobile domain-containing protein n=1 Tax=Arachis hypogaea TaxID=3818 RepID=A0A444XHV7_ARAHY|nr:hypothetical protein Ahy_B09g096020 [Arachis hypogaea]
MSLWSAYSLRGGVPRCTHLPFGEYTITLQDVAYQLGLSIDGKAVSGCLIDFENFMEDGRPAWEWFQKLFGELPLPNKVKQMTVHFTWFHERFRVLPADASEDTVRICRTCLYHDVAIHSTV